MLSDDPLDPHTRNGPVLHRSSVNLHRFLAADPFRPLHSRSQSCSHAGQESINHESTSSLFSAVDAHPTNTLLDRLLSKHSDRYRFIEIPPTSHRGGGGSSTCTDFCKRVSFDTINIEYFDEYNDDDQDFLDISIERGRSRSLIASPNRSPSPSQYTPQRLPPPLPSSGQGLSKQDLARIFRQSTGPSYPSRPIVTHRGCTYTKLHHQFEKLYLEKLVNADNSLRKPILPSRVILVYISGRKHTWVALDWVLRSFVEDGDSIVVVAAVNSPNIERGRRRYGAGGSTTVLHGPAMTPKARLRRRNMPAYTRVIAQNTMTYCTRLVRPDAICKITVELAVGATKAVLKDMCKLYQPSLMCTGSKPALGKSAPLKSWHSAKLSDRLVKNFPLPVIVVPAVNMEDFEVSIGGEVHVEIAQAASAENAIHVAVIPTRDEKSGSETEEEENAKENCPTSDKSDMIGDDVTQSESDDSSDTDSELITSGQSNSSFSSYDEISQLYCAYKREIYQGKHQLYAQPINDKFFLGLIKLVLDKLAELCHDLREVDPDFRRDGAKLARAITGLNMFGTVPYKTRLMLSPDPSDALFPHTKSGSTSTPRGISYKETMRRLQQGSVPNAASTPPPPENRKTKFVGVDVPEKRSQSSQTLAPFKGKRSKTPLKRNKLMRSLSHETYTTRLQVLLEPTLSEPDLEHQGEAAYVTHSKKSKSKMKKFLKIFG